MASGWLRLVYGPSPGEGRGILETEEPKVEKTYVPVSCRWMRRVDLPTVAELIRSSEDPLLSVPSEETILAWLRASIWRVGVVAEFDGVIVGIALLENRSDVLRLEEVIVSPVLRRRKVGAQMVNGIIQSCTQAEPEKIFRAEVRDNSLGAHLFLKSLGFQATGILRDHFREPDTDGYLFEFSPLEHAKRLVRS